MRAIGRDPIFIERGSGAELTDVDGNVYVDYVCSWGPLIHGHAHPAILEAVTEAAAPGHVLRRADGGRGRARRGRHGADAVGRHAADDVVGHRGVDERDPARARGHRPRQAAEVRRRLPRARRRAAGPGRAPAWPRRASRPRPASRRPPRRTPSSCRGTTPRPCAARSPSTAGGRAGRALPGQHGPDPARGGLPRAAARPLHGLRHAAGLRRGHHRLPRRPGRRAGTHGCAARPDGDGQDPRRRAARRGLRRLGGADGADRARRRRLPGRAR